MRMNLNLGNLPKKLWRRHPQSIPSLPHSIRPSVHLSRFQSCTKAQSGKQTNGRMKAVFSVLRFYIFQLWDAIFQCKAAAGCRECSWWRRPRKWVQVVGAPLLGVVKFGLGEALFLCPWLQEEYEEEETWVSINNQSPLWTFSHIKSINFTMNYFYFMKKRKKKQQVRFHRTERKMFFFPYSVTTATPLKEARMFVQENK